MKQLQKTFGTYRERNRPTGWLTACLVGRVGKLSDLNDNYFGIKSITFTGIGLALHVKNKFKLFRISNVWKWCLFVVVFIMGEKQLKITPTLERKFISIHSFNCKMPVSCKECAQKKKKLDLHFSLSK